MPAVEQELQGWEKYLKACPPGFLQEQARQSIARKRFHCQGGAAYALPGTPEKRKDLLSFIVAFQTISDYLDNLCDRLPLWPPGLITEKGKNAGKGDTLREQAFRFLHVAMHHALELEEKIEAEVDYYRYYPYKEDGGYLQHLVKQCQQSIVKFPNYKLIQAKTGFLTGLYCDLQTFKHLSLQKREEALKDWFKTHGQSYFYLDWYEFAAAAGSTLGVFALLAAATHGNMREEESAALFNLYFPWICGLHILLDYFIDQAEDYSTGDLNFVFYYDNEEHLLQRLYFFIRESLARSDAVTEPLFHRTIVKGLLALYLSDPKIKEQGLEKQAHMLLTATGERDTYTLFHACQLLRRKGRL